MTKVLPDSCFPRHDDGVWPCGPFPFSTQSTRLWYHRPVTCLGDILSKWALTSYADPQACITVQTCHHLNSGLDPILFFGYLNDFFTVISYETHICLQRTSTSSTGLSLMQQALSRKTPLGIYILLAAGVLSVPWNFWSRIVEPLLTILSSVLDFFLLTGHQLMLDLWYVILACSTLQNLIPEHASFQLAKFRACIGLIFRSLRLSKSAPSLWYSC